MKILFQFIGVAFVTLVCSFIAVVPVRAENVTLFDLVDSLNQETKYYKTQGIYETGKDAVILRAFDGNKKSSTMLREMYTFCVQEKSESDDNVFMQGTINLSNDGFTTKTTDGSGGNYQHNNTLTMGAATLYQLSMGLGRFDVNGSLSGLTDAIYQSNDYSVWSGGSHENFLQIAVQGDIWAFQNGDTITNNDKKSTERTIKFLLNLDLEAIFGEDFLKAYSDIIGIDYVDGKMNTLDFWKSDYNPLLDYENAYQIGDTWYQSAALVTNFDDNGRGGDGQDLLTFVQNEYTPGAPTPEPASMLIFGLGTLAAGAFTAVRRKRK
ncbi:hypothetical protein FACS189427_01580 [Planctomycetales bacterium]|nr:hypothetical protein FACS189427_01580 [Planctomycetales bacterium]